MIRQNIFESPKKPYIAPPSPYYDRSDKTQLYVWGLNDSDQILKREGRILTPTQSKQISQMEIKDVQMSSKGTIILNKTGIVSIIGDLAPKPATANGSEIRTITAGVGFVAISTHCTGRHWLGLDRLGRVWSCDASTNEIRQIPNIHGIIDISAGYEYSLALDRDGKVYGWGNNKNYRVDPKAGFQNDASMTMVFRRRQFDWPSPSPVKHQFANPSKQEEIQITDPVEISDLSGLSVIKVIAGSLGGASHILTEDGSVYGWGKTSDYQLGIQSEDILTRQKIEIDGKVVQLSSGAEFTAALDDKGTIWTWGRKHSGRLGNSNHAGAPRKIEIPESCQEGGVTTFIDVKCGALHCIAYDASGQLWSWGDNSHGQLGQEQSIIKTPQIIGRQLFNIAGISSGSGHCGYWTAQFCRRKSNIQFITNSYQTNPVPQFGHYRLHTSTSVCSRDDPQNNSKEDSKERNYIFQLEIQGLGSPYGRWQSDD